LAALDVEFEHDVLAECLRDKAFVRIAIPVLRRHDFSSRILGWVWSVIHSAYSKAGEIPSGRVFGARVSSEFEAEDDQEYAIEVLKGLWRRRVEAPRTALETIRDFVRQSVIRKAAEGIVDGLDAGDLDKAEDALKEGAGSSRAAGLMAEPEAWADGAEARLRVYLGASRIARIPTPLPTINKITQGGLRAGSFGLVVANTNVGKSSFAVDLGYAALVHGESVVLHVTTEETLEECAARYDARFTGIERAKLLGGRLTAEDREIFLDKIRRRGATVGKRLVVHELSPGSDFGLVRMLAERVREQFPDDHITVVIDSPDHLKGAKRESYRLEVGDVYWRCKAMALDPTLGPLSVWATTQAPKAFEGKTLITSAVSENYDKIRVADFGVGMMEGEIDAEDPDDRRPIEFIVTKNRLGGIKKRRIYVRANLGTCQFDEVADVDE